MRRTYERTLAHLRDVLAAEGHDEAYRVARDWLDVLAELRGLGHHIHEAQVDIERAALTLKLFGSRIVGCDAIAKAEQNNMVGTQEPVDVPHRVVAATDAAEHRMPV